MPDEAQTEPSLFDDNTKTPHPEAVAKRNAAPAETAGEGHGAARFADEIKAFVASAKTPGEYRDFVTGIFNVLKAAPDDPVWTLLAHLERETDFYTAPASTRFHGAEPGGLVRHSLLVTANGIRLAPVLLSGEVNLYYLVAACLFHDLCKVNMYETKTRNVKNEETGKWESAPYYSVKQEYLAFGHGIESQLRLSEYITLPPEWNHAIRWHMGAYDISPSDKYSLEKALAKYQEVLLLQTADIQAGLADGI
jgi:hypothetical protein